MEADSEDGQGNQWRWWPVPGIGVLHISDPKDIWRYMTTAPPTGLSAGESGHIKRAFHKWEVIPGMSRSLVVRLLGFPNKDYRSYAEIVAGRRWSYDLATPFSYDVDFDASGRVVRAEQNGTMP